MIGSGLFWGAVANLVATLGLGLALGVALWLSLRGKPFGDALGICLAGGTLTTLVFYLARLPGYHDVCVGIFGDTEPCTFAEFAADEAKKAFVVSVAILIGWLLVFCAAYSLVFVGRRLGRTAMKQTHELKDDDPQSEARP